MLAGPLTSRWYTGRGTATAVRSFGALARGRAGMATDDDRVTLRYATASNVSTIDSESNRIAVYSGPHLLVVARGIQPMMSPVSPSALAVEELRRSENAFTHEPDPVASVERSIESLRETFRKLLVSDPHSGRNAVLLTGMLWSGTHVVIAHIGTTRAYMLRGGELTQLTRDHNYGQLLLKEGLITSSELGTDPQHTSVVVRWIDAESNEPVDIISHEAAAGDRYILCTDAIEGIMSAGTFLDIVKKTANSTQDVADELAGMAFPRERYRQFGWVVCDIVERAG